MTVGLQEMESGDKNQICLNTIFQQEINSGEKVSIKSIRLFETFSHVTFHLASLMKGLIQLASYTHLSQRCFYLLHGQVSGQQSDNSCFRQ